MGNLLKTALFTVLVPGTVAGLVPLGLLLPAGALREGRPLSPLQCAAATVGVAALGLMLWCAVDFAIKGRGTPAPIDPPKELVVRGAYRWTRNPMYVGVVGLVLSEAVFFRSLPIAMYAACLWVGFHAFVVLYEEPALTRKFGDTYTRYREDVPRWLPMPWRTRR